MRSAWGTGHDDVRHQSIDLGQRVGPIGCVREYVELPQGGGAGGAETGRTGRECVETALTGPGSARAVIGTTALLVILVAWLWTAPPLAVAAMASALVLLGLPHGAVDHRIARPMLGRFGQAWFAVFTLIYLGAAGLVLSV